jgi:hypothetical protein
VPYVTEALPSASTQHGYKPLHSVTTTLLPIVTKVAMGFNEAKPASRTAMVALDILKAFDAIDHVILLDKVADSSLNSNVVRWLASYLRGRTAVCLFQGAVSKVLKCHEGLPQGSVLSPHIFNFFVSDFPALAEENGSFADNFHLTESSPNIETLNTNLTEDLKEVDQLSEKNKFAISPEKSSVTLFTPWNREINHDLEVFLGDALIPVVQKLKHLG